MKLCVISTIAQHKKGFEIHLRNLSWALSEYDYEINIQTYKSYGFKTSNPRVNIIEVDSNPFDFYFFWNETSNFLLNCVKKFDFFLFMEQDIFFVSKLKINANSTIKLNLHSDYLSIFDENKNLLYPRLWEGCMLVKSDILSEAISKGIRLGSCKKIPIELLNETKDFYTTKSSLKFDFQQVKNYIHNSSFLDTMFEFTLYCFKNKIPFEIDSDNYELSKDVIHFRGSDMIVRDNKEIYIDPKEMIKMASDHHVWKRLCNGCAFLFLISDIYKKEKTVEKMILNKHKKSKNLMCKKIELLKNFCEEWMTKKEIENLYWCDSILKKQILML